jgi:hypothetical protein
LQDDRGAGTVAAAGRAVLAVLAAGSAAVPQADVSPAVAARTATVMTLCRMAGRFLLSGG